MMVGAMRKNEIPEGKKGKYTEPWKMPTFRCGSEGETQGFDYTGS